MTGIYFKGGKVYGVPQETTSDTFLGQNFEAVTLSDFTHVGLTLETASPISGTTSAKLTHDSVATRFFKETKVVTEKYRNVNLTVLVTAKSAANSGNVTISFYDETNALPIQTTQQLIVDGSVQVTQLGVRIPNNCNSFSYTISALPQSGSPVTYIDDVTIKNYWPGVSIQGQTDIQVPSINTQYAHISQLLNVTQANITGALTESQGLGIFSYDSGTGIYTVLADAVFNISVTLRTSGASSVVPQISVNGTAVTQSNTTAQAAFKATTAFNGRILAGSTFTVGNASSNTSDYNWVSISAIAITTSSMVTNDIVPAKALTGTATIDVPAITSWQSAGVVPVTALTTPLTKGTVANDVLRYRRIGDSIEIDVDYSQSAGAGAAGSGLYLITLPNNLQFDLTKVSANTTMSNDSLLNDRSQVGQGWIVQQGGLAATFHLFVYDATRIYAKVGGTLNDVGTAGNSTSGNIWEGAISGFNFGANLGFKFRVSAPIKGWESTEAKSWSSTQTLVSEEESAEVKVYGSTGYGSSYTYVLRFTTLQTYTGNAIQYIDSATEGASFTALKDGWYSVTAYIGDQVSVDRSQLAVTKNGTQYTSSAAGLSQSEVLFKAFQDTASAAEVSTGSWSGPLKAGDVIRVHSDATVPETTYTGFSMTYAGGVSQIQTVADQKIDLPSSELTLRGASTKGATDTSVVVFDSIEEIRGDAFTVSTTVANGTIVTVNKAGLLHISSLLLFNTVGNGYITRNSTNLGTADSVVSATGAAVNWSDMQWSGYVDAGDTFRINYTNAIAADVRNHVKFTLIETRVAVSVTNTLPQFEDRDFFLKVTTASATYGATNTLVLRFTTVVDSLGPQCVRFEDSATLGSSFTILQDGLYDLVANGHSNTNNDAGGIAIVKNATSSNNPGDATTIAISYDRQNTASAQNRYLVASASAYLRAGDVVRVIAGPTILNNSAFFSISKSGRPTVTGVDVTSFVQGYRERKYHTLLTGVGGVSLTASVTNIPYIATQDDLSGWDSVADTYTVRKNGTLTISGIYRITAGVNILAAQLFKNGVSYKKIGVDFDASVQYVNFFFQESVQVGNVFSIRTSQNSTTQASADDFWANIILETTDEQILSEPDTFSTDTTPLVYAGSGQYTLTTLANAPVGTFITFTYAINTNTRTQTTTAPTQTTTDMNVNGLRIFTRPYNAASTAGSPTTFAIQIGKTQKGVAINLYKNVGKATAGMLDLMLPSSTAQSGLFFRDYNESTGILILDAGYLRLNTNTANELYYTDTTTSNDGYLVINASKNPALVGINTPNFPLVRAINTSAQSIPANIDTAITWDSASKVDTHAALGATTFTAPENGYYEVYSSIWFSSYAWQASSYLYMVLYKNGVVYSYGPITGIGAAGTLYTGASIADTVYLNANDTIYVAARHSRSGGNSSFDPASGTVKLLIKKVRK